MRSNGVRLKGPKIERRPDVEESIMLRGLGCRCDSGSWRWEPIIILTELVTGGYTKIATIISTDLPRWHNSGLGIKSGLWPISIEGAHDLFGEQEERLKRFKKMIL